MKVGLMMEKWELASIHSFSGVFTHFGDFKNRIFDAFSQNHDATYKMQRGPPVCRKSVTCSAPTCVKFNYKPRNYRHGVGNLMYESICSF